MVIIIKDSSSMDCLRDMGSIIGVTRALIVVILNKECVQVTGFGGLANTGCSFIRDTTVLIKNQGMEFILGITGGLIVEISKAITEVDMDSFMTVTIRSNMKVSGSKGSSWGGNMQNSSYIHNQTHKKDNRPRMSSLVPDYDLPNFLTVEKPGLTLSSMSKMFQRDINQYKNIKILTIGKT